MAAPMAVAASTVPNTDAALMAFVAVALYAAKRRFRRLRRGAKLWVVVRNALGALLEKAEAVGGGFKNVAEGRLACAGRTGSAELQGPVGQLRRRAGNDEAFIVSKGLLNLTEGCVPVAGRLRVAVLEAKAVFGEPVLRADAAKLSRPVAKDVVVVASAALYVQEALAMKTGLCCSRPIVAATGRPKPSVVTSTDGIRSGGLTGSVARAYLSGRIGWTTDVACRAKKKRITRGVFVAFANALIVAKSVGRTFRTTECRTYAVECFRYSGTDGFALCPTSQRVALTDRGITLQTAYAPKVAGLAETVRTRRAGHVALFGPEGLQRPIDALGLSGLRVAPVAECAGAAQGVQGGLGEVELVALERLPLQEPVVVLLHTDKIAGRAQKLYLDAVCNLLDTALVAVGIGQGPFAVGVVRTTNVAEGAEPLVLTDALPTKAAQLWPAVGAKVELAKGSVEGHLAVAAFRNRVVGKTVLAVVEERPPEDADGRPEKNGRPDRCGDEEQ